MAEGWCWWYRKYAPEDVILAALEAAARVARKGLWVDSSPMLPWEWRALTSFVLILHDGLLGHYLDYPLIIPIQEVFYALLYW